MKVIYHIGSTIGSDTVVKRGILREENSSFILEAEPSIELNDLKYVEYYRLNGLGTMVKLKNGSDTIFLCVPRLFINIGTGFAVVNTSATRRLKQKLDALLHDREA